LRGTSLFTATLRTRKEFLPCQRLSWPGGRTIGALRAERRILTSANGTSCSARHERSSRAFLFTVSAECALPTNASLFFLQFLREFWPMPLPLMIHSALALFAQRTRIPTSARSIGFCVIWVCISSSSSSSSLRFRSPKGFRCGPSSVGVFSSSLHFIFIFLSPPPEGGLDVATNRQGAI